MGSQIIFFVIIFLYVYYIFVMENNNKKTYKIVLSNDQKKEFGGPCSDLKKKLSACMKNSDDTILECQSVRNSFEQCLEKHFHR